mgnify:CR=1 FL=1
MTQAVKDVNSIVLVFAILLIGYVIVQATFFLRHALKFNEKYKLFSKEEIKSEEEEPEDQKRTTAPVCLNGDIRSASDRRFAKFKLPVFAGGNYDDAQFPVSVNCVHHYGNTVQRRIHQTPVCCDRSICSGNGFPYRSRRRDAGYRRCTGRCICIYL